MKYEILKCNTVVISVDFLKRWLTNAEAWVVIIKFPGKNWLVTITTKDTSITTKDTLLIEMQISTYRNQITNSHDWRCQTDVNEINVLAPVVQRLDNKTNHTIRWIVIYPVDSVIQLLNNRALVFISSTSSCWQLFSECSLGVLTHQ